MKTCCCYESISLIKYFLDVGATTTPQLGGIQMNKSWLPLAAALALSAGVASAQEVRVYNWSDYIDEELLAKFEEETGIKLIYDVFDSNEVLETKMLAGGSGYDVVVPTGTFLQRQITAGVFQTLDFSKLPNAGNLWDVIRDRTEQYDPGNAYSINYMWGTTTCGAPQELA